MNKGHNELGRKDKYSGIYIYRSPHHNLIELLLYSGHQPGKIKEVTGYFSFPAISDSELKNIYNDCIAFKEGEIMISENRKRLPLGKELYKSDEVGGRFAFVEIYDAFMCNPKVADLPFSELIINREKRRLLECSLVYDFSFKLLQKAWDKKYKEKLASIQYDSYSNYCFDLKQYSGGELDQFIDQNPEYPFYDDFKYILGRSKINFLTYFSIATIEAINRSEKQYFELAKRSIQGKLRSDPNSISNNELSRYHTLEKANREIIDNDIKKNKYDKELTRIFARTIGKERQRLASDMIKNKRRLKRIENPTEQDEILDI